MLHLEKARLTAFVLIALTAACGGTVVYEEDGGQGLAGQGGNGNGDGGSASTASDGGSVATVNPSTTTNVSSGLNTATGTGGGSTTSTSSGFVSSSVGPGPGTGPISASTGNPGCGSLIDDLGGLGEGPRCNSCAEAACCGELLGCTEGTSCWDCIFGGPNCNGQGEQALDDLVSCVFEDECESACNGGGCDEFQCFDSGECIPFDFVCNGRFNCEDGTDESPDVCGQCGPDGFFCNDGFCIPGDFVCDGVQDCSDGEDELCQQGICDSGVASGDRFIDQCLGEVCCFEFEICSSFGEDVDACFACFNDGGGPLCDDAIICANNSGCFDQPASGICGSGLSTGDFGIDECLSDECCSEFEACSDFGNDPESCFGCFEQGGGPLCDDAIDCTNDSGCF